jgi:hypothetical protein
MASTGSSTNNHDKDGSAGVSASAAQLGHGALAAVADAIARMRYGAVQLTIHDGRVVQLEVTERQRFP